MPETLYSCGFYDHRTLAETLDIIRRDHVPAGKIALVSFQPGTEALVSVVRDGNIYELIITTGKSHIGEHIRRGRSQTIEA